MTLALVFLSLAMSCAHPNRIEEERKINNFINESCNHTTDHNFCVKTLGSDPDGTSVRDLAGLTAIALKITVANATDTYAYISELLNRSGSDKKESFEDCLYVYRLTVDYLQLSVPALQQKNYIDLKVYISGSLINPADCEEGFSKDGSPLTQRNNNMTKLMLMTLDLVNYLSTS
ncbi:putative invertase inhibitor [Amborella trichopoda]|uniref:putative invertase inhibitor n=1 Tax=Amborella trichopoda TaxID=13333 RepID=UPI0005D2FC3A|nr:putative invertase inhibitor [Amborella trichopoda]|eukprot:XP_011621147.1 putative invertase inhibitor [Amborella trichopoda]